MANVVETKNVDLLRKRPDGDYTKHNPTTIAKNVTLTNGSSVETEINDLRTLQRMGAMY